MKPSADMVPSWTRVAVGILAFMNIAYGVTGYFTMSVLFKNTAGIDLSLAGIKNASFEFAARNLAIGLALGIVSLRGVPESIAIVTIIRALIEIQTIIITIAQGDVSSTLLMPITFLAIEVIVIVSMVNVVKKRNTSL